MLSPCDSGVVAGFMSISLRPLRFSWQRRHWRKGRASMPNHLFCGNTAALLCTTFLAAAAGAQALDATSISTDPSGALQTINANGRTNTNGAFFQSLGTNGRSCSTCHVADQAMSVSPPQIQE